MRGRLYDQCRKAECKRITNSGPGSGHSMRAHDEPSSIRECPSAAWTFAFEAFCKSLESHRLWTSHDRPEGQWCPMSMVAIGNSFSGMSKDFGG